MFPYLYGNIIIITFLYFYTASTTSYLTKCTSAVILGFFTPRDGVDKDLMCAHHHGKNLRLNFIEIGETRSLISHLIMNYCPAGGSILDVTDIQGM